MYGGILFIAAIGPYSLTVGLSSNTHIIVADDDSPIVLLQPIF